MDQHKEKARHYAEAANRAIGPPSITRLVRRTLLAPDAVRDVVLMGLNARHPMSVAIAEAEPLAVTFDTDLLLACRRGADPAKNRTPRRKDRLRFPAP